MYTTLCLWNIRGRDHVGSPEHSWEDVVRANLKETEKYHHDLEDCDWHNKWIFLSFSAFWRDTKRSKLYTAQEPVRVCWHLFQQWANITASHCKGN
jgi:hypothetical protein